MAAVRLVVVALGAVEHQPDEWLPGLHRRRAGPAPDGFDGEGAARSALRLRAYPVANCRRSGGQRDSCRRRWQAEILRPEGAGDEGIAAAISAHFQGSTAAECRTGCIEPRSVERQFRHQLQGQFPVHRDDLRPARIKHDVPLDQRRSDPDQRGIRRRAARLVRFGPRCQILRHRQIARESCQRQARLRHGNRLVAEIPHGLRQRRLIGRCGRW